MRNDHHISSSPTSIMHTSFGVNCSPFLNWMGIVETACANTVCLIFLAVLGQWLVWSRMVVTHELCHECSICKISRHLHRNNTVNVKGMNAILFVFDKHV